MTYDRRAAAKKKRIQQVKRQKLIVAVVAIGIMITVFIYTGKSREKEETAKTDEAVEVSVTDKDAIETSEEVTSEEVTPEEQVKEVIEIKPVETPEERLERVRNEAETAGYPEGVIELLSKNSETVDFVENYGTEKDRIPAQEIAEFKEGEIPQILQWDARWGYAPYGTSIVAVSGCGPTCLSMVISGLTGDKTLTPAKMAEYGTEHHYVTAENDTTWAFIAEAGNEWGIRCREKMLTEDELKKELKEGHPVICSVGPGYFTQRGHFIVLVGYEDGKVIVHDPFSQTNSDKKWKYEKFKDQIKSMWTYWKES